MQAQQGSTGVHVVPVYKPEPVPKALLHEIFDAARLTPSWHNPRGWHISVLTGAVLQRFKDDLTERLRDNAPGSPDLEASDPAWPELCLLRTARLMAAHEEAEAMASLEGSREEKLTHLGQLFGAPCALIYSVDCETTGSIGCFNSGAFIQCMCQAAGDRGLSTCVLATAVKYPALLHAILPDQTDKLFVAGVALGYPDTDTAVAASFGEPVEFEHLVSWVE
jgi:nitroreductase